MNWLLLVAARWIVVGLMGISERRAIRRAGNEPRPLREIAKDAPYALLTYFVLFGLPIIIVLVLHLLFPTSRGSTRLTTTDRTRIEKGGQHSGGSQPSFSDEHHTANGPFTHLRAPIGTKKGGAGTSGGKAEMTYPSQRENPQQAEQKVADASVTRRSTDARQG